MSFSCRELSSQPKMPLTQRQAHRWNRRLAEGLRAPIAVHGSHPRGSSVIGRAFLLPLLLPTLFACSTGQLAAPVGNPVPDPALFAANVRDGSIPAAPLQITFGWTLDEAGSRVSGRGVVRLEAPERSRLDLFGPRGETYLTAALVDGEYRLPRGAVGAVALPSASLLWSAAGVVQPPSTATLTDATEADGNAELRYAAPGGELFVYRLSASSDGAYLLDRLERAGTQGVLETVTLERDTAGTIVRTRYRDWTAFRDLVLEVESVREAAAFPSNIWSPDAATP
jgi:hypothetical protein